MNFYPFENKHIGPSGTDIEKMLQKIGEPSAEALIEKTIPADIGLEKALTLPEATDEYHFLKNIKSLAAGNKIFKTYIGQGYYNTIVPSVILRNILENPAWYTSYTPYQAEISQGRLEALLNFQTVIAELTGMELANASLLDEGTAAAEAMIMFYNTRSASMKKSGANQFFVDEEMFPQTYAILKTRAAYLDIELVTGRYTKADFTEKVFGAMVQYPDDKGNVSDYAGFVELAHAKDIPVAVIADVLSLCLLSPPGEWGADVVAGSTQRFGIPMGYGGPHAAYFAAKDKYKRNLPGRIIGVTKDANENQALRMALQTREQHIKRQRATSNICTAQALLATMAGMYAMFHGAEGLKKIARRIHSLVAVLAQKLENTGFEQLNQQFFDTLLVKLPTEKSNAAGLQKIAMEHGVNFRYFDNDMVGISLDEANGIEDVNKIIEVFSIAAVKKIEPVAEYIEKIRLDDRILRKSDFMGQEIFKKFHSETDLMRYIKKLERKDISLTHSMISLGSCTMKLNSATSMLPLSWPEFGEIHPFVPMEQAEGYQRLIHELGQYLCRITGFEGVSFQPNSGANGEYAGLLVIREYLKSVGQHHRDVALIPSSAHGTNPASAVMAGMKVEIVNCDENGNIDLADLEQKAVANKDELAAIMITYPSTHGVFEDEVRKITSIIHQNGGQVYMDGANMNAQVGLTNPKMIGADVCHLNLHKTFAIPHGGGGPGVGPICVADHLVEFLPSHPVMETGGTKSNTSVAAAPFGSASILSISYAYCKMLGAEGLKKSSMMAIVNANYLAKSIDQYFKVLYKGKNGYVAHEMIVDCREFKEWGITETDIAKRLMDYGFHAPTLSFPVAGTLMVEPTESESLDELNRFVEAMISIFNEIQEIKSGQADKTDNVLKNAPHTQKMICSDEWDHLYSRQKAAFPLPWIAENKFWPAVARVDDAFGDRNLVCTC